MIPELRRRDPGTDRLPAPPQAPETAIEGERLKTEAEMDEIVGHVDIQPDDEPHESGPDAGVTASVRR